MVEETADKSSDGGRWGPLHRRWPSLPRRETQAPRAMRVVTTAVKTTEESTKGIRNMNFMKVLCFQLGWTSQNCRKTPLKIITPVDIQKLLTSLTILP